MQTDIRAVTGNDARSCVLGLSSSVPRAVPCSAVPRCALHGLLYFGAPIDLRQPSVANLWLAGPTLYVACLVWLRVCC